MPTITTHFAGTESVSGASEKAAQGIRNLKKDVRESIQPFKDLYRSFQDIMMLGGLGIVGAKVISFLGDAQKSFEKLHPEIAKSSGSLTAFTGAMDSMKASIGGGIETVLNPMRAFFVDMVNPTYTLTSNIKDLNVQLDTMLKKYGDVEKAQRTQLLLDQVAATKALTDATMARVDVVDRLAKLGGMNATREGQQDAWAAFRARPGIASLGIALGVTAGSTMKGDEITKLQQSFMDLTKTLDAAEEVLQGVNKQLAVLDSGGKTGTTAAQSWVGGGFAAAPDNALVYSIGAQFTTGVAPVARAIDRQNPYFSRMIEAINRLADAQGAAPAPATYVGGPHPPRPENGVTGTGAPAPPPEGPTELDSALSALADRVSSVNALYNWQETILNSMFSVLGPAINQVLAPLVGILAVTGNVLGQILMPAVQALAPVVSALADGFLWLYNKVIMPVGNGIWAVLTGLSNMFINLGSVIYDIITLNFAHIGKDLLPTNISQLYQQGPLAAITKDTLTGAGLDYMGADQYGNTGASSSTTVQKPADNYFYITFSGPIVGTGGEAQAGAAIVDCIKAYVGTGGRVTVLQG